NQCSESARNKEQKLCTIMQNHTECMCAPINGKPSGDHHQSTWRVISSSSSPSTTSTSRTTTTTSTSTSTSTAAALAEESTEVSDLLETPSVSFSSPLEQSPVP